MSREVLSSVQQPEGQPDGRLSTAGDHEDAAGGAVSADQGCACACLWTSIVRGVEMRTSFAVNGFLQVHGESGGPSDTVFGLWC